MAALEIRKATIRRARLRAAFCGPSKSGKTFISLVIARDLINELQSHDCLRGNGRIGVLDSEDGRSEEHYGDIIDFDIAILNDYSPEGYISAIDNMVAANYSVIIIDQISHEWAGKQGLLEQHAAITEQTSSKNSFMAWGSVTPRHNRFIETLVRCPVHLICTMRAKQEWELETNENGKKIPVKLGLGPVQRDSTEYEFDIFGEIDQSHILTLQTRGSLSRVLGHRKFLPGPSIDDPGEVSQIGKIVGLWLADRDVVHDLNLATKDQIDSILLLGERLGLSRSNWTALWKKLGIQSQNSLTPEMAELVHKDMTKKLAKKNEKAESVV